MVSKGDKPGVPSVSKNNCEHLGFIISYNSQQRYWKMDGTL